MGKFGLSKRCRCPRRMWTKGCRHSWYYIFKWKGRRYRAALDDELRRHVGGKTEALKEVEKIYDAVRDGTFGRESAKTLTLRQLGDRYFKKYVSLKTGRPLGRNERYRWNVMIEAKIGGRPVGDCNVSDLRKHHVETFVDANRVERIVTIVDAKGNTYPRSAEALSRRTAVWAGSRRSSTGPSSGSIWRRIRPSAFTSCESSSGSAGSSLAKKNGSAR
jgi:hypothetical protein